MQTFKEFLIAEAAVHASYDMDPAKKEIIHTIFLQSDYVMDDFKSMMKSKGMDLDSPTFLKQNPALVRYVRSLRFRPTSEDYLGMNK